jgi:peptidoglycan/xylan/chitin deacetylase (PgdA/CDA1 family)
MLTQLDDQSVARELAGSRRECEEGIGRPCRSVAYPYGDHDERIVRAAREAGYTAGCSVYAPHPPEPLCWPRIGVYHPDNGARFRLKVSAVGRRFRASRVFGYLNALRG